MLERTPSPLDAVVQEAARKLSTLQMTRLSLEPEKDDLDAILADLDVLCDIFDGVIGEVGQYAGEYFGVSAEDIKNLSRDQLRGALEGNLTFALEQAFKDAQESKLDGWAPYWERG